MGAIYEALARWAEEADVRKSSVKLAAVLGFIEDAGLGDDFIAYMNELNGPLEYDDVADVLYADPHAA